jgi:hypothetical protein
MNLSLDFLSKVLEDTGNDKKAYSSESNATQPVDFLDDMKFLDMLVAETTPTAKRMIITIYLSLIA